MRKEDKKLFESSKTYSKSLLQLLKKNYKPDQIDTKILKKYRIKELGLQIYLSEEPDFNIFIHKVFDRIVDLTEFKAFKDELLNHKVIGTHIDRIISFSFQGRRFDLRTCIISFVTNLLERMDDFEFNEDRYAMFFNDFVNSFYQSNINMRAFVLLYNFNSTFIDKIDLKSDLTIRKITDEEFEEITSERVLHYPLYIPEMDIFLMNYIIEIKYQEKKDIVGKNLLKSKRNINEDIPRKFRDVVKCIRLIQPSNVGFNSIHYEVLDNMVFNYGQINTGLRPSPVLGKNCIFNKDNVKRIKKLFKAYKKVDFSKNENLKQSIERYNFGQDRNRNEDKIIDYFIALESLLITSENNKFPELSEELISELKDEFDKNEIRNIMGISRQLRNNILHAKISSDISSEVVNKLEEYVSFLIRKKIYEIS